jgi:hypothetical protein
MIKYFSELIVREHIDRRISYSKSAESISNIAERTYACLVLHWTLPDVVKHAPLSPSLLRVINLFQGSGKIGTWIRRLVMALVTLPDRHTREGSLVRMCMWRHGDRWVNRSECAASRASCASTRNRDMSTPCATSSDRGPRKCCETGIHTGMQRTANSLPFSFIFHTTHNLPIS